MPKPDDDDFTTTATTTTTTTTTLIIGLSGPSSSGKTTLARLLRRIFNIPAPQTESNIAIRLFILHEDDFYKTDLDIPTRSVTSLAHGTRDLQDWDCVESLDLELLGDALGHVQLHGQLPASLYSKEDRNSVGESGVHDAVVSGIRDGVLRWLDQRVLVHGRRTNESVNVCVLDGFLLFPPPLPGSVAAQSPFPDTHRQHARLYEVMSAMLDVKLFLPSTRQLTLERRARRSGYVTLEGFWEDPPGYVEDVVWPNYARDHAWMFADAKDVDLGRVDGTSDLIRREEIRIGPGEGAGGMEKVLEWGVERVKEGIVAALNREDGSKDKDRA